MRRLLIGSVLAAFGIITAHVALSACSEPEDTSYGNPNTLDRKNLPGEGGVEPLNCGGGGDGGGEGGLKFDGGDCPSFATDIFPAFTANGVWRCAAADCHGGATAPTVAGGDAGACLTSLKAIAVGGVPYVSSDGGKDPAAQTLLCNLQGTCGSKMPKPPATDPSNEDLCKVEAWLKCGAPP